MDAQPNNDDAAIAEFHASARRGKARVYGVAGVLGIVLGIAAIVVTFAASDAMRGGGTRYEIRIAAVGVAFVLLGLFALFQAWRIGTGRANDFDYDPR
jgi:hypothetical protein